MKGASSQMAAKFLEKNTNNSINSSNFSLFLNSTPKNIPLISDGIPNKLSPEANIIIEKLFKKCQNTKIKGLTELIDRLQAFDAQQINIILSKISSQLKLFFQSEDIELKLLTHQLLYQLATKYRSNLDYIMDDFVVHWFLSQFDLNQTVKQKARVSFSIYFDDPEFRLSAKNFIKYRSSMIEFIIKTIDASEIPKEEVKAKFNSYIFKSCIVALPTALEKFQASELSASIISKIFNSSYVSCLSQYSKDLYYLNVLQQMFSLNGTLTDETQICIFKLTFSNIFSNPSIVQLKIWLEFLQYLVDSKHFKLLSSQISPSEWSKIINKISLNSSTYSNALIEWFIINFDKLSSLESSENIIDVLFCRISVYIEELVRNVEKQGLSSNSIHLKLILKCLLFRLKSQSKNINDETFSIINNLFSYYYTFSVHIKISKSSLFKEYFDFLFQLYDLYVLSKISSTILENVRFVVQNNFESFTHRCIESYNSIDDHEITLWLNIIDEYVCVLPPISTYFKMESFLYKQLSQYQHHCQNTNFTEKSIAFYVLFMTKLMCHFYILTSEQIYECVQFALGSISDYQINFISRNFRSIFQKFPSVFPYIIENVFNIKNYNALLRLFIICRNVLLDQMTEKIMLSSILRHINSYRFDRDLNLLEISKNYIELYQKSNNISLIFEIFQEMLLDQNIFSNHIMTSIFNAILTQENILQICDIHKYSKLLDSWFYEYIKNTSFQKEKDLVNKQIILCCLCHFIDNYHNSDLPSKIILDFIQKYDLLLNIKFDVHILLQFNCQSFNTEHLISLVAKYASVPHSFDAISSSVCLFFEDKPLDILTSDFTQQISNQISFLYYILLERQLLKHLVSKNIDWFVQFLSLVMINQTLIGNSILNNFAPQLSLQQQEKILKRLINLSMIKSIYCIPLYHISSNNLFNSNVISLLDEFLDHSPYPTTCEMENSNKINIMSILFSSIQDIDKMFLILHYYLEKYQSDDTSFRISSYLCFFNTFISRIIQLLKNKSEKSTYYQDIEVFREYISKFILSSTFLNILYDNNQQEYKQTSYLLFVTLKHFLSFIHIYNINIIDSSVVDIFFQHALTFISNLTDSPSLVDCLCLKEIYLISNRDFESNIFLNYRLDSFDTSFMHKPSYRFTSNLNQTLTLLDDKINDFLSNKYHDAFKLMTSNFTPSIENFQNLLHILKSCKNLYLSFFYFKTLYNMLNTSWDETFFLDNLSDNTAPALKEPLKNYLLEFLQVTNQMVEYKNIFSSNIYFLNSSVSVEIMNQFKLLFYINLILKIFSSLKRETKILIVDSQSWKDLISKMALALLSIMPLDQLSDNLIFQFDSVLQIDGIKSLGSYIMTTLVVIFSQIPYILKYLSLTIKEKSFRKSLIQFIKKHLCPVVRESQISDIENAFNKNSAIDIIRNKSSSHLTIKYTINDDTVEIDMNVPFDFPFSPPLVKVNNCKSIKSKKLLESINKLQLYIIGQQANMVEGIINWKNNLEKCIEGVNPCVICYCVLHQNDFSLPSKKCAVCQNKVHHSCISKWFQTTNKKNCPICRSNFY